MYTVALLLLFCSTIPLLSLEADSEKEYPMNSDQTENSESGVAGKKPVRKDKQQIAKNLSQIISDKKNILEQCGGRITEDQFNCAAKAYRRFGGRHQPNNEETILAFYNKWIKKRAKDARIMRENRIRAKKEVEEKVIKNIGNILDDCVGKITPEQLFDAMSYYRQSPTSGQLPIDQESIIYNAERYQKAKEGVKKRNDAAREKKTKDNLVNKTPKNFPQEPDKRMKIDFLLH